MIIYFPKFHIIGHSGVAVAGNILDIIDKSGSEDTLEALGCDGTAVSKISCIELIVFQTVNSIVVFRFKQDF